MTEKTWQEKQEENRRVYEAAKKIISSWPEWKRAIAMGEDEQVSTSVNPAPYCPASDCVECK